MSVTWINSFILKQEVLGGMVLLPPTSISFVGSGSEQAEISGNGLVEFTDCTSISLNGVFSSGYDNYIVSMRFSTTGGGEFRIRFRSSGTDNSTAGSYVTQYLDADGSTKTGVRTSATTYGIISWDGNTIDSGCYATLYGPNLSIPTVWQSVNFGDSGSASVVDFSGRHNQSSSYDGLTFIPETGSCSGHVTVYGLVGG